MTSPALVIPLLAFVVAGCVSTRDEPFALDDGDGVAAQPGDYSCKTADANGAAKTEQARLVRLRRAARTQYLLLAPDNSSAEPFTLHRAKGDTYIAAVAHAGDPGEDLYVAQLLDNGKEFRLYAEGDDLAARARTLARQRGATFAPSRFGADLGGPVEAQRTLMVELASDLKGWKLSADCRFAR
jgi:hypothetical protein